MTTTPFLGLETFNTASGSETTFLDFRLALADESTNLLLIDEFASQTSTAINTLNGAVIHLASATRSSAEHYEASVTGVTAYYTGMFINLNLNVTNTGTAIDLNINSLGAKYLKRLNSSGVPSNFNAGELQKYRNYIFVYDGTYFVLTASVVRSDELFIPSATACNIINVSSACSVQDSGYPILTGLSAGTYNLMTMDATGRATSASMIGYITGITGTGVMSSSSGSTITHNTTSVTPGAYNRVETDSTGHIVSACNISIISAISGSGVMSDTCGSVVKHNKSAVTSGSYNAFEVDEYGHIFSASNIPSGGFSGAWYPDRDINGLDLSGFAGQLSGANFATASFIATSASVLDFSGSRLNGANFSRLFSDGVNDFSYAELNGANLSNLYVTQRTSFESANLRGANLSNFYSAKEVILVDAHLDGAILNNVTMYVSGTTNDLSGAYFDGVVGNNITIVSAFTQGTYFSNGFLKQLSFHSSDLHGMTISHMSMQETYFISNYFADSEMRYSDMSHSHFETSDFTTCSALEVDFSNSKFIDCNMTQFHDEGYNNFDHVSFINGSGTCVFTGMQTSPCSIYTNVDFTGMDLTEINFNGVNLAGTKFANASLTSASFVGANLAGCDFTGAEMTGTNFTDAILGASGSYTSNDTPALTVTVRNGIITSIA